MHKLHAKVFGRGDNLVLLHGWVVCSSDVWQDLIAFLAKKYRVIVIDLPGFGRSPLLSKNYALQTIAEQILEIAPQKAIWLGWSLGGLIAMWIAIYAPERVSKLITVACTPRFIEDMDWPGLPDRNVLQSIKHLAKQQSMTLFDFLRAHIFYNVEYKALLTYFMKGFFYYGSPRLTTIKGGLNLIRTTDLRAQLAQVTCPLLKIFGEKDVIIPTLGITALQKLLPKAKITVIPNASHTPFLSQQSLFLEILDKFIASPS